jgi:hypothetical protein
VKIGEKMPDGAIFAGISPETRHPMFAAPADRLLVTFNRASELAARKTWDGQIYRIPTEREVDVLYKNRAAIGGFNETGEAPHSWYYSTATESKGGTRPRFQRFSDGYQGYAGEWYALSLRLVRS